MSRLGKTQSKVKELARNVRDREEEIEDTKRKVESMKMERRRSEKTHSEVRFKYLFSKTKKKIIHYLVVCILSRHTDSFR